MGTNDIKKKLAEAKHPQEDSRFRVAIIVSSMTLLLFILLAVLTFGIILLVLLLFSAVKWLALKVSETNLIANAIMVSEDNFPEVKAIVDDLKVKIGYDKKIPVFIVNEGDVNAGVAKFFGTKYIILNSGLVEGMRGNEQETQLRWIIGRFIGSFKAKHYRLEWMRIIVEGIEQVMFLNFFILPYERKLKYTGDNIGLLVCSNLTEVMIAFDKLLVGNKLAKDVSYKGLLGQSAKTEGSFFSLLARLFSSHPHMMSRYLNLLAYARKYFPDEFDRYVEQYDTRTASVIGSLLPKHYL